jgi:2,3-bisphosphoglycerate-dependent phosphoglycerate mutase
LATDLFLIRHAQQLSATTPDGELVSDDEDSLSALGHWQAQRLAERLARTIRLDALYSSSLLRALETAQPLGELTRLETHIDGDLVELRIHLPPDITPQAAREAWLRTWRMPTEPALPDGESYVELQQRAASAIGSIVLAHPNQKVAVVTHGGVTTALFRYFLGVPAETVLQAWVHIDHTSIFHWRTFQIQGTSGWELLAANDTHHLD